MHVRFHSGLLVLVTAAIVASTNADLITVRQDGSGDYTSIQEAVDAASDGDEVVVGDGTWLESFEVAEKSIEVRAENSGAAILDGEGVRNPITVSGETTVTIRGFAVNNGSAAEGGGLYVNFATSAELFNCSFTNNTSTNTHGGAIYLNNNAEISLQDCVFIGNSSALYGGAIHLDYGADITALNCTFTDNQALTEGGAVWVYGGQADDTPAFENCLFSGNQLTGDEDPTYGAGLRVRYGPLTLDTCTFSGNTNNAGDPTSNFGGGVYLGSVTTDTVISDCVFEENVAGRGGGIYLTAGAIRNCTFNSNSAFHLAAAAEALGVAFEGCTFQDNTCALDAGFEHVGGGAVHFSTSGSFLDCTFTNNEFTSAHPESIAHLGGGAIYFESGDFAITNCTFSGNQFQQTNTTNPSSCGGGAIHAFDATLAIDGTTSFNANTVNSWAPGAPVFFGGGAIHATNGSIAIADATFAGNSVDSATTLQESCGGGALWLENSTPRASITGSTFSDNVVVAEGGLISTGGGGAIFGRTDATLENCSFSNNIARERPSVAEWYMRGGACLFNLGNFTASNCSFIDNEASYRGGSVMLEGTGTNEFTGCTTTGNGCDLFGALDWTSAGPSIANSLFCDNGPANLGASNWTDLGGNTFSVHCKGSDAIVRVPEDYGTILSAIRHSISGDTIQVGPGTYVETLNYFGRDIDLVSTNGPETTIIDLGGSVNHCIEIGSPSSPSLVEGFTLRNAQGPYGESGTGIFGEGGETLTVRDCILEDLNCTISSSSYRGGAGIYWDGNLEVENTAFLRCRITHVDGNSSDYELIGGGAIKARNGTLSVRGCTFDECTYSYSDSGTSDDSESGGGAIHATNSTFTLDDSSFRECAARDSDENSPNTSARRGGAIYLASSLADISNTTFTDCSCDASGGSIYTDSDMGVADSDFSSCQSNTGGAIHSETAVNLSSNTFTSNNANGSAGAVWAAQVTSIACTFSQNSAGVQGGGLRVLGSLECTDTVFELNSAEYGGGAFVWGEFTFSNCTFDQNAATNSGGGIHTFYSWGSLDTCVFTGNSSNDGGGFWSDKSFPVTIQDTTFLGNNATNDGGGLYCEQTNLILTSCTIEGNSAVGDGGGMYSQSGGLQISQLACQGNSAGEDGGGIKSAGDGVPVILDSSFLGNSSTYSGGGVEFVNVGGENGARMANCEILGNSTEGAGGGIRISDLDTKVTLVDCVVGENSAEVGGGINSFDARQVTLQNVTVYNNHASLFGGGIYDEGYGGGLQETVINESIISGNTAGAVGGGIYLLLREMAISNTNFCGNDPGQIIGLWSDYGGNTFSETTCFFDCNANGIEDSIEIAEGALSDCDSNSIPDICEIADGSAEDCDGDGVPDVCAKGGFVTFTSGTLPAAGTGVPQSLVIPMAQASASSVTVTVEAIGDLSSPYEYLVLELNSTKIGTLFTSGTDCSSHPAHDTAHIDAVVFNSAAGSGQVTITVLGTVAVDPNFCSNGMTRITVSYTAALNGDCNENGVLDACEIANGDEDDANGNGIPDSCEPCIGDFNGDDVVSGGDLGFLLGLFNTANSEADLNGDGFVDAADLGLLLSAWGPC